MQKHAIKIEFNRSAACERVQQHIEKEMQSIYFCGYRLDQCFEHELFRKLTDYAESGFCYELAAIAMFLLKDFPLSKLVHGTATLGDESGHHAIVKFSHGHEDFVLDLAWFGPQPIPESVYNQAVNFRDPDFEASYTVFWDDAPSRIMFQYLRAKELSHLLQELAYYRPSEADKAIIAFRNDLFGTGEMIEHLHDVGTGYKFIPRPTASGKIIDQRLVNEFMSDMTPLS